MGCDHFHFLFSKTGKNQGCEENQRRKEEVRHDVEACIKYGQMGLSELLAVSLSLSVSF